MRLKILYPILSIFLFSCQADDSTGDRYNYWYRTNSQIVLTSSDELVFHTIEAGDQLVFQYAFSRSQDPDIADDEYGENIIFQVDPSLNEFNISGVDLNTALTHYIESCFCDYKGAIAINEGSIIGERIGLNQWEVSIDVSFNFGDEIRERQLSGIFIPFENN